jgi:hypothetical protein
MVGPRRTAAQRTGQLAEAAFAKAATQAGMIWHPTSAGSDFGIDGKIEIVESGTVGGAEFNVQIKGTALNGHAVKTVNLGLIKVSTITYWMSKLLPTLLVFYDESADRLFYGWLHDVISPADVFDRQAKGRKRMRLRMPAKRLTNSAWQAIDEEGLRAHEAVRSAFDDTPVRSYYHILYCLAADVTDLLIDVVAGIAYASPLHLAVQFGGTDTGRVAALAEEFLTDMPPQPAAVLQREHMLIMMQLQAFDHELRAFLVGKFMFHDDNPIVRATESIERTLRGLIDEIVTDVYGPEPTGKGPGVRWAKVDLVKLVCGVGSILVLLRDYQRELRPFLFPIWGKLDWPVRADETSAPPLSTRMVRDISDSLVTSFASWRADDALGEVTDSGESHALADDEIVVRNDPKG